MKQLFEVNEVAFEGLRIAEILECFYPQIPSDQLFDTVAKLLGFDSWQSLGRFMPTPLEELSDAQRYQRKTDQFAILLSAFHGIEFTDWESFQAMENATKLLDTLAPALQVAAPTSIKSYSNWLRWNESDRKALRVN